MADAAGFWVEEEPAGSIVLHCSPGVLDAPDFEQLLVRVRVDPLPGDDAESAGARRSPEGDP